MFLTSGGRESGFMRGATVAGLVLAMALGLSQLHGAPGDDGKLAEPTPQEKLKAERLIRDVYKEQFARSAPPDKRSLARMLFRQARDSADDPVARYVMLELARDIATQAGDAWIAADAIAILDRHYKIDRTAMETQMLGTAYRYAQSQREMENIAEVALRLLEMAIEKDDFEAASQAATHARRAAQRSGNAGLANEALAQQRDLTIMRAQYNQAKDALEKLATSPNDPAANLTAGRYLCLYKGDFTTGLSMLAKGDDAKLRELAMQDLADPKDAEGQKLVGDAWWDYAQELTMPLARRRVEEQARYWYRKAVKGLSGLTKATVEKRLAPDSISWGEKVFVPGLAGFYFAQSEDRPRIRRVDPLINFTWGLGAPGPGVGRDHFRAEWVGWIYAPVEGRYEFQLKCNDRAELYIDGEMVVKGGWAATGSAFLYKGFNPIHLKFFEGVDNAQMTLEWTPPNGAASEIIPEDAYFHEPSQE